MFEAFVDDADLHEVFLARSTCRGFASNLNQQLFSRIEPAKYDALPAADYSTDSSPRHFLDKYLAEILYGQVSRRAYIAAHVVPYVYHVADMLGPAPTTSLKASKRIKDLTYALASVNQKFKHYINCAASTYFNTKEDYGRELEYFTALELTTHDKLGAAAAVGDEAKVRRFLAEGVNPMAWVNFGFDNPVQAAASTGKTGCLVVLLEHAEKDVPDTRIPGQIWLRDA